MSNASARRTAMSLSRKRDKFKTCDVVGVCSEYIESRRNEAHSRIHKDRFERSGLQISGGQFGFPIGMLWRGDTEHANIVAGVEQALRDAVHRETAAIGGGARRLVAKLEDLHGFASSPPPPSTRTSFMVRFLFPTR